MLKSYQEDFYCAIDSAPSEDYPIITVGVVVLNRQWILQRMLDSLKSQTYPHDRLYVVIADGESKDNTAQIAQDFLQNSDFYGYDITVQDCSIPEGRNLCIQKMKGEFLLFWDSDVVMDKNAICHQLHALEKEKVDIATSNIAEVYINSCDEIEKNWTKWASTYFENQDTHLANDCTMGNTLISKRVLSEVKFDDDLTYGEDMGFSFRALELGYKILGVGSSYGFDINKRNEAFSDHSFDMPIKRTLRGIRKKGVIEAVTLFGGSSNITKDVASFFLKRKRYAFYLAYIPLSVLAVAGVLTQNLYLVSSLPLYITCYSAIQVAKRGIRRGFKAVVRSIIVGVPTTCLLLYYSLKLIVDKPLYFKMYGTQNAGIPTTLPFAGGLSPDVT